MFVDPDCSNVAAILAYEKAGFKKIEYQHSFDEIWMIENKRSSWIVDNLSAYAVQAKLQSQYTLIHSKGSQFNRYKRRAFDCKGFYD